MSYPGDNSDMLSSDNGISNNNRRHRGELGGLDDSQYDQYYNQSDNLLSGSDFFMNRNNNNSDDNNLQLTSDNLSSSNNYSGLSSDGLASELPDSLHEGTKIQPRETIMMLLHFFSHFTLFGDDKPFYMAQLERVLSASSTIFNLDLAHFEMEPRYKPLITAMVFFPQQAIKLADFVINRLAAELRDRALANQNRLLEARQAKRQNRLARLAAKNSGADDDGLSSDARYYGSDSSIGGLDGDDDDDDDDEMDDVLGVQTPYHSQTLIIRPFNLGLTSARQLTPDDLDQLVAVRGMVLRVSGLNPDMKIAAFVCSTPNCPNVHHQAVVEGILREPHLCTACNRKDTFRLEHARSKFASKQVIRIQEVPEDVQEGETPHTLTIFAYDDLVDCVKPGDRVAVTGIFRGENVRVNPRARQVTASLFTHIDAFHFKLVSANSVAQNSNRTELHDGIGLGLDAQQHMNGDLQGGVNKSQTTMSEEEQLGYLRLSRRPDIYEILARSISPSVWGLDDVKKGLLSLMVGGNNLEPDGEVAGGAGAGGFDGMDDDGEDDGSGAAAKRGKRGSINVLLVGDPGTAKSQLLQYIHKLSSRGVYTSGTASSAAGLTASVTRDPVQNEMVLEPGALVISDGGICCIDEFDKMAPSAQSILHEAMEQQTVSIAKAGVICSLSARTSILASANPRDSRYNPALSIVQNIDLPPTLISRFDLIYIVLDTPNQQSDERLAHHLLQLFMSDTDRADVRQKKIDQNRYTNASRFGVKSDDDAQFTLPLNDEGLEYLPTENLIKYINLARTCVPTFTDEACYQLEQAYLDLRGVSKAAQTLSSGGNYNDNGGLAAAVRVNHQQAQAAPTTISATTRQLQSLVRISESLAKISCRDFVSKEDVVEATRLIRTATLSAAIDPVTGKIDMNALSTGVTTIDTALLQTAREKMQTCFANHVQKRSWSFEELVQTVKPSLLSQQQNISHTQVTEIVSRCLMDLTHQGEVDWQQGQPMVIVKGHGGGL